MANIKANELAESQAVNLTDQILTLTDAENNTVTLGDHEDLFSHEVICSGCFFPTTGGSEIPEFLKDKKLTGKK